MSEHEIVELATRVVLQTTLVAALVWLVCRAFARFHPALRHTLSLGALAGALAVPLVAFVTQKTQVTLITLPPLTVTSPSSPPLAPRWSLPLEAGPVASHALPATSRQPSPLRIRSWVAAAWLSGVVVLLLRLAHGWWHVRRLIRGSVAVSDPRILSLCRQAAGLLHMRRVPEVRLSEDLSTPVAVGLWRPVILLPADLACRLESPSLRDVLLHESAHILRRDAVGGLLQRIAAIVYWPHPLIHLLNRELSIAREEVCDNHVLCVSDRAAYARTLLDCSPDPGRVAVGLALWQPHMRLLDRIHGLLNERRVTMTKISRAKAIVVGSVLALALFAMGTVSAAPGGDSINLSGEWQGAEFGKVYIRGDVAKYENTAVSRHGLMRLARTGRRGFSGFFQESESCGGTLQFSVSADGQTLAGVYRVDEQATTRAGEQGNFTLTLQAKLEDGDADAKLVAEKKLKMEMIEQRKAQGRGDPSQDDLVKLRSLGDMGMPDDKLARIEQELRAAVDDKLGRLGADHIDTLRTQQQLAVVMAQRGQQAEALALLEQTVAGAERVLGHEHPQTLSTRGQLAEQLLQLGRLDEALVTLQDVIAIQQRTLPDDNLDALLNKARLGEAMEKRGDLSQAETLIRQVMDTLRKTRGDGDPETQRAMSALEALLRKLGRSDEADQLGQARRKKGKGGPF